MMFSRRCNFPGSSKLTALICILAVFCISIELSEVKAASRLNVILITCNSVRADHMNRYGYYRKTFPSLEAFVDKFFIFENAITQSSWTLPSQASLLTSTYVMTHGVYDRKKRLSDSVMTLPEILKIYGYTTAAFVGGLDLSSQYGLNQGFDSYDDQTGESPMRSVAATMQRVSDWLYQLKESPFFLFIQTYDNHLPYSYPEQFRRMFDSSYKGVLAGKVLDYPLLKQIHAGALHQDGTSVPLDKEDFQYIIDSYDGGLGYLDHYLAKLLNTLQTLGLWNNTIVFITAEHGEALGTHGSFDRYTQQNLYDEVVRVPLLVYHPQFSKKPKRIRTQVQLVDVMPTILEMLDIPLNKESIGVSFLDVLLKRRSKLENDRYAFAEASPVKWMIRSLRWKLICDSGRYELYDLRKDVQERYDQARTHPDIVYELLQRARALQKENRAGFNGSSEPVSLSDDMKKKLQAAGYW